MFKRRDHLLITLFKIESKKSKYKNNENEKFNKIKKLKEIFFNLVITGGVDTNLSKICGRSHKRMVRYFFHQKSRSGRRLGNITDLFNLKGIFLLKRYEKLNKKDNKNTITLPVL